MAKGKGKQGGGGQKKRQQLLTYLIPAGLLWVLTLLGLACEWGYIWTITPLIAILFHKACSIKRRGLNFWETLWNRFFLEGTFLMVLWLVIWLTVVLGKH